ncbi:hypothetical protein D3C71_1051020 [compost metagenome]
MQGLVLAPDAAVVALLRHDAVGNGRTIEPEAEIGAGGEHPVAGDDPVRFGQGVDQDQRGATGRHLAAQRQLAQQIDVGALGELVGHLQALEDAGVGAVGVGADAVGLGPGQQAPDLVHQSLFPG